MKYLVFDLDDTLLDTHRLLIPEATREACNAMIKAGLNADLEMCLKACESFRKQPELLSRIDLFLHISELFGSSNDRSSEFISEVGADAFYNRKDKIGSDISLSKETLRTLQELKSSHELYLVTSGAPETQGEKIRILSLRDFFKDIYYVDTLNGERKLTAFTSIMERTKSSPEDHLSIGNRIDTDIAEAKLLGWRTCWVRYGEYAAREPKNESEQPDFIINHISELIETCRL